MDSQDADRLLEELIAAAREVRDQWRRANAKQFTMAMMCLDSVLQELDVAFANTSQPHYQQR